MIIVILGPPGGGKGTQAQNLARRLNLVHISVGDILRKAISDKTDLGKKVKEIVENGGLVPDELINRIIMDRLEGDDLKDALILDGYPRTLGQALALDTYLKEKGRSVDITFYLDTSDEEVIKRLSGRQICSRCGENQRILNLNDEQYTKCPRCGAPLLQRRDDREDVVRERLKNYHSHTVGLLNYYKERGILQQVNGEGNISEVFSRLLHAIGTRVKSR